MASSKEQTFEVRFLQAVKNLNISEVRDCLVLHQLNQYPNINVNEILIEAIKTSNAELVRMMLNGLRKLNLTYKDEGGMCALHHGAETGKAEIAKDIIQAGSIVNILNFNTGYSALHYAAKTGNPDVVRVLVKEGAHMNRNRTYKEGNAALHLAVAGGHVDVVNEFIKCGANINVLTTDELKRTPLHIAVQGHQYEVIQALIDAGADISIPDVNGRSVLHLAAENGTARIFQMFVESGITDMPLDLRGRKPLHIAVQSRQTAVVQYLVNEIPGDVDCADNDGLTPLLVSVLGGFYEIASILLTAGASVNIIEFKLGATALNLAVSTGRLDMIRLLLENGADPQITDFKGVTPLHRAQILKCEIRSLVIRLLIMHGAKMNSTDEHGYTPLDRCVFQTVLSNFDKDTLKLMTSAGAHLQPFFSESRRHKNSPLCWLVWRGDLESARFLVNSGWNLRQEQWLDLPGRNEEHNQFIEWLRRILHEPRALIHLCRLTIRERMSECSKDRQILSGIDTLPLPTVIKKFLKFQEEMDMLK